MIDLLWMPNGGLLLDSTGDLASTNDPTASVLDIARSRLKAALTGWKNYSIGADLQSALGESVSPEIEVQLQRQVTEALTDGFLPSNALQVQTLAYGETIRIVVFLQQKLLVQAVISRSTNKVAVS